jgi:hypothetical protein
VIDLILTINHKIDKNDSIIFGNVTRHKANGSIRGTKTYTMAQTHRYQLRSKGSVEPFHTDPEVKPKNIRAVRKNPSKLTKDMKDILISHTNIYSLPIELLILISGERKGLLLNLIDAMDVCDKDILELRENIINYLNNIPVGYLVKDDDIDGIKYQIKKKITNKTHDSIINETVKSGNVKLFQDLDKCKIIPNKIREYDCIRIAASNKRYDMVKFLFDRYINCKLGAKTLMLRGLQLNQFELVKMMYEKYPQILGTIDLIEYRISEHKFPDYDLLVWMRDKGFNMGIVQDVEGYVGNEPDFIYEICGRGDLRSVLLLSEYGHDFFCDDGLLGALSSGNEELVDYICNNIPKDNTTFFPDETFKSEITVECIARTGNLNLLKRCKQHGNEYITSNILTDIASNVEAEKYIKIANWLLDENDNFDNEYAICRLLKRGNLELIKRLEVAGVDLRDDSYLLQVIKSKNMELIEYMYNNHYDPENGTIGENNFMIGSIMTYDLDIVLYIHVRMPMPKNFEDISYRFSKYSAEFQSYNSPNIWKVIIWLKQHLNPDKVKLLTDVLRNG